jgi:hypothetical protein
LQRRKKEKMPKLLLIIHKKMLNFVVFAESMISSKRLPTPTAM